MNHTTGTEIYSIVNRHTWSEQVKPAMSVWNIHGNAFLAYRRPRERKTCRLWSNTHTYHTVNSAYDMKHTTDTEIYSVATRHACTVWEQELLKRETGEGLCLGELLSFREDQGRARTQSPTNRNCAPESPTFGVIAEVNPPGVQWTGLALGEPPSGSGYPLRQVSMLCQLWTLVLHPILLPASPLSFSAYGHRLWAPLNLACFSEPQSLCCYFLFRLSYGWQLEWRCWCSTGVSWLF